MMKRKRQYGEELYVNLFSIKTHHQRAIWPLYTARSILTILKMKLYNKSDFKFYLILSCIISIIISLIPAIVRVIKYAHLNEYGVWIWIVLFVYWVICLLILIVVSYIIIFLIMILYKRYKGETQK